MKLRLALGSVTVGLALVAACSSGDPVVDSPDGSGDDDTPHGGFDASTTRHDAATDAAPTHDAQPLEDATAPRDAHVADSSHDASQPFDASHDAGPPGCSCAAPPPNACSGKDVTTYGAGECTDAACTYPPTTQTCTDGCVSGACSPGPFEFLGNTATFANGGPFAIGFSDNPDSVPTVPSGSAVTVITQTYARGTVQDLQLYYDTDSQLANKIDLPFTFDHASGNNDQWYAIIPALPAGTQVYFYVQATPFVGAAKFDPSTFQLFLTYRLAN